jgi:hypothetical protein
MDIRYDSATGRALSLQVVELSRSARSISVTERSRTRTVPRFTALFLVWALGVPLAHGVAPWAVSLLS